MTEQDSDDRQFWLQYLSNGNAPVVVWVSRIPRKCVNHNDDLMLFDALDISYAKAITHQHMERKE